MMLVRKNSDVIFLDINKTKKLRIYFKHLLDFDVFKEMFYSLLIILFMSYQSYSAWIIITIEIIIKNPSLLSVPCENIVSKSNSVFTFLYIKMIMIMHIDSDDVNTRSTLLSESCNRNLRSLQVTIILTGGVLLIYRLGRC